MRPGRPRRSSPATVTPLSPRKQGHSARPRSLWLGNYLIKSAGGVGQHGVHLAGVGGQVVARPNRTAIAARDIVEQPLEFVQVGLNGLATLRLAIDFVSS